MHGNRRRKKRPSYGVRTVEITKGHTGYGFTISGQAPCILSCIVPASPAEKAGLRPGDYLIAVNGQNVSKALHDDVVRLVGQSKLLKLQIAENYYSDSSDDEFTVNRPKPKYPNRLRHKHQQTRAEKVVRDLQSGAIFSEHAAIHNSENAPLCNRDWTNSYTPADAFIPAPPTSVPVTMNGPGNGHNPPKSSTSPTRLRPDQICIVMAEARQVPRNSLPLREEAPMHPPRVRQGLKKREKMPKGKMQTTPHHHHHHHHQLQELEHEHQHQELDRESQQQQLEKQQLEQQLEQQQHEQQQQQQWQTQHSSSATTAPPPLPQQEQQQSKLQKQQQLEQEHQHQSQSVQQQHHLPQQHHHHDQQQQTEIMKGCAKQQIMPLQPVLQQKQIFQHQHLHNNRQHSHKLYPKSSSSPIIFHSHSKQFQENLPPHQHPNFQHSQIQSQEPNHVVKSYPQIKSYSQQHQQQQHHHHQQQQQPISQMSQYLMRQQQLNRQLNKQGPTKPQPPEFYYAQQTRTHPPDPACNGITEQEINNFLYPTLAEIQQNQMAPEDMGDVIYRAVVGYLGTIEMPKEPQGGSRLTAIRNCIRRLRIEKKVHTLVLMSILSEQVVLTNPHGLTLAEYPAERITFCGVYADDKKFFGLVTVHGSSGDELSDGSQNEGIDPALAVSSSCHVFMVDPNAVQHPDHCRRAKNFRIDCTPGPAVHEDGVAYCLEFPDSADPILHAIMSLYRNRVGFHLDTGASGLIDVEAQLSPQHSNTSSNSSNSDSGIGFRDEGGHHYHNSERVFVVEFDDNQRTRLHNLQIMSNLRVAVTDNQRICVNTSRANIQGAVSSTSNNSNFCGETSDNPPQSSVMSGAEKGSVPLYVRQTGTVSGRVDNHDKTSKGGDAQRPNTSISNSRLIDSPNPEMDENLRVSVSDPKKLMELRSSLSEGKIALPDGRSSVTEELRNADLNSNDKTLTPGRDCTSPQDGNRLTVRAMPDPVSFERSSGYFLGTELPTQVSSMRHSMHKYLQHKQEHLVKVSQKINRRESDSGSVPHPLSVRAFSPGAGKRTPTPSQTANQGHQNMDLSLKLSPKVFGVPFRSSAPSEHSFTRSLEDLRDSSTSDGVSGSMGVGVGGGSFRDGSESDHGLARLLHASETNLVRCSPTRGYTHDVPRGAFRAVHPRIPRSNHVGMLSTGVLPRVGRLSDVGGMRELPCLGNIAGVSRPLDSGDENTETTENTGGQGGSQDVHPPTQDEFSHDSDSEQVRGKNIFFLFI